MKLHGMPQSVISDRDPIFISKFWQEFFKMSGSQLKMSYAYHPQTDGQFEVLNRCVEYYLCCFVHQQSCQWSSFVGKFHQRFHHTRLARLRLMKSIINLWLETHN